MSLFSPLHLVSNSDDRLDIQLAQLHALTLDKFAIAENLVDAKLQSSMRSLEQSTAAIRLLLASQDPAQHASAASIAMRADLEALLASSTHLTRLAGKLQKNFASDRHIGEERTAREISNVVQAVRQHRSAIQDSAIALTEAALDKARTPSSPGGPTGNAERRVR